MKMPPASLARPEGVADPCLEDRQWHILFGNDDQVASQSQDLPQNHRQFQGVNGSH